MSASVIETVATSVVAPVTDTAPLEACETVRCEAVLKPATAEIAVLLV